MSVTTQVQTLNASPIFFVTCCECGNSVPSADALDFEIIEAIDGNQENLALSNIRYTGKIAHECRACFLACLAEPDDDQVLCAECDMPVARAEAIPHDTFYTLGNGQYLDTGLCYVCPACEAKTQEEELSC